MHRNPHNLPRLLWLLPCCYSTALLALSAFEWITVGVVSKPGTLARYPFGGGEGPMEGAKYYGSAQAYSSHCLILAWASGCAAALFLVAGLRARRWTLALAYCVLLGGLAYSAL
jgi:hypothetical protein